MNDDRTLLEELPGRKTRSVEDILHFLTPQQMAEEIVRLDAAAAAALSAAPAQEPAEDNWVAKVVSSGPHDFPLLQWRSAAVSLDTPIGTLLYASPLTQDPQEGKALTDAPLPPEIEGRLSVWLTLGKELHPLTVNLVVRFARALASKLADAEKKYGYSDGWRSPDWMDECRAHLMEHIAKGDPRDVAAYCAFLWHHGESTASPIERELRGAQEVKAGEDARTRGMAIYRRAKETAMERAALVAFNTYFFKCTPSCDVATWTAAWKKAIAWWTSPVATQQQDFGVGDDRG